MKRLIGPFKEIITMSEAPLKGALAEDALGLISKGGILIEDDLIVKVGAFSDLKNEANSIDRIKGDHVLMAGLIDSHTHICFGGSRAGDYAQRVAGKTYQEILKNGGGIHDSVSKTRAASEEDLTDLVKARSKRHLEEGVTTIEVKSGYGLSVAEELKMLHAIQSANEKVPADLISTCLAAHVCPKEFDNHETYLEHIATKLFPELKTKNLTNRIDIFTEDGAFDPILSAKYLTQAKADGFDLTVHADQFTPGGTAVAISAGAVSADHLEAISDADIALLAASETVATVLPGASLGLGMHYSPARKLLDAGCCLAIATDWNPGSAPMGDLLIQTALIGSAEKLSISECIASITFRAAKALNLSDRGRIKLGQLADLIAFPVSDHREIFYQQGKIKPNKIWKRGVQVVG
ncbi:imidazolonepropionase [Reichenbachiella carrageenanivorans]|uniref:Imidazolonepropionase n=1 Tax=Reichenbachiella carrageenanivorans TaxID=2979869 RepID=A0ABY6D0G6_9BACT|nr:imidazolonepropionase [Reichenbachiella carrageenanivorans]UXX79666.1 imidazolonepropionase [Reichenbachiella carrageenanivorans]